MGLTPPGTERRERILSASAALTLPDGLTGAEWHVLSPAEVLEESGKAIGSNQAVIGFTAKHVDHGEAVLTLAQVVNSDVIDGTPEPVLAALIADRFFPEIRAALAEGPTD